MLYLLLLSILVLLSLFHNQIDYILIKGRFRSGINVAKTRVYNKAVIGGDHDLVMMYFKQNLNLNEN